MSNSITKESILECLSRRKKSSRNSGWCLRDLQKEFPGVEVSNITSLLEEISNDGLAQKICSNGDIYYLKCGKKV